MQSSISNRSSFQRVHGVVAMQMAGIDRFKKVSKPETKI